MSLGAASRLFASSSGGSLVASTGPAAMGGAETLALSTALLQARAEELQSVVSGGVSGRSLYDRMSGAGALLRVSAEPEPQRWQPGTGRVKFKSGSMELPLGFKDKQATIGRAGNEDLSLAVSELGVADRHVQIVYEDGQYTVTNISHHDEFETWVDGRPLLRNHSRTLPDHHTDLKLGYLEIALTLPAVPFLECLTREIRGIRSPGELLNLLDARGASDEAGLVRRGFAGEEVAIPLEGGLREKYDEFRDVARARNVLGEFLPAVSEDAAFGILSDFSAEVGRAKNPDELVRVIQLSLLENSRDLAKRVRTAITRGRGLDDLPQGCGIRSRAREMHGLLRLQKKYLPGLSYEASVALLREFYESVVGARSWQALVDVLRGSMLEGMFEQGDRVEKYFQGQWFPGDAFTEDFRIQMRVKGLKADSLSEPSIQMIRQMGLLTTEVVDRPWMQEPVPPALRQVLDRYFSADFSAARDPQRLWNYQRHRFWEALGYDEPLRDVEEDPEIAATMAEVKRMMLGAQTYEAFPGWVFRGQLLPRRPDRDIPRQSFRTEPYEGRIRLSLNADFRAFAWVKLHQLDDFLDLGGVSTVIRMNLRPRDGVLDAFVYFDPRYEREVFTNVVDVYRENPEMFRDRASVFELPLQDVDGNPLTGVSFAAVSPTRVIEQSPTFAQARRRVLEKCGGLMSILVTEGEGFGAAFLDQFYHAMAYFLREEGIDPGQPAFHLGAAERHPFILSRVRTT